MSYLGNPIVTAAFVTDQFNGTGSQTAFTMSVAPANTASILVIVSGVTQSPDSYSINGLTLTFSAAPPFGTGNISVRYLGIPAAGIVNTAYRTVTEFTATAGQTTFTPPSYTVGYITVLRNGVQLGTADFTATNGTTVVLASGATAGDLITTISFYVSSVLNAIPAVANAVTDTYLNAGAVTQTKLGANVAGNGPAFRAYASTNQTGISTGVATKVTLDTEVFDTNNNFASSRFTPTVAGYYQISGIVTMQSTTTNQAVGALIFKNGVTNAWASTPATTGQYPSVLVNALVYLNGSTDYVELYVWQGTGSTQQTVGNDYYTFMTGSMVRGA